VALILAAVLVLLTASAAAAQDATRLAMARVRLTTDPKVPVGCATLGTVNDDSLKDLRRKVVRMGGDTALLSFPAENLERMNAIVFRCPPVSASTPPSRPAPQMREIPVPPAGTPPAPPPEASAPASR
jgi:hypothetical protein